jgi:type I restriction enzyme S subunit
VGCTRESHTLAALRDALLPRLVSGELRVKDAEGIAVTLANSRQPN